MSIPKISIITPSFNQGRYIEQTILSVLNQNYPNLEYIIIDGGSTDNTVEIIKKYESEIEYWVSEPDKGQTDAINKGFSKCTGDIFNWINSDDYYEPGTFDALAKLYNDIPTAIVFCGKEWGFRNENPANKILHPGSVVCKNISETIRIGIINQPCTFWKKQAINGFFPLDISLRYVMDRQLWWCFLLKYGQQNIVQVDNVFTWFRLHDQSKSESEGYLFENEFDRLKLSLLGYLNAPQVLLEQFKNIQTIQIQWQLEFGMGNEILAAFALQFARYSYVRNDWKNARKLMQWVRILMGSKMGVKELKLWLAVCAVPPRALKILKQIKKRVTSCALPL